MGNREILKKKSVFRHLHNLLMKFHRTEMKFCVRQEPQKSLPIGPGGKTRIYEIQFKQDPSYWNSILRSPGASKVTSNRAPEEKQEIRHPANFEISHKNMHFYDFLARHPRQPRGALESQDAGKLGLQSFGAAQRGFMSNILFYKNCRFVVRF